MNCCQCAGVCSHSGPHTTCGQHNQYPFGLHAVEYDNFIPEKYMLTSRDLQILEKLDEILKELRKLT